jgi:hypothetical protein
VIQVLPSAFRRVEGQSCRGLECYKTVLRLIKRVCSKRSLESVTNA